VSQQAPNHCAALNMDHLLDANRRHPLQADGFRLVAGEALSHRLPLGRVADPKQQRGPSTTDPIGCL
jgi:hypothetical protein